MITRSQPATIIHRKQFFRMHPSLSSRILFYSKWSTYLAQYAMYILQILNANNGLKSAFLNLIEIAIHNFERVKLNKYAQ